jgi:16S rRNA (cytosine1407-C5)-methyltransferase
LYLLTASSLLPTLVLAPRPGETILDLAAAPGGKAMQMAAAMDNRGTLSVVEPVKGRFFRLKANLSRYGVTCARAYRLDGAQVWHKTGERFDRVLLDAPCSSEARFREAEPDTYRYWSPNKIRAMQRKQLRLLYSGIRSLKPGGTLVYCTCSFAPEENEVVVSRMLSHFGPALEVETVDLSLDHVQRGLVRWNDHALDPRLSRALRVLPATPMEGSFICRLRKHGSLEFKG